MPELSQYLGPQTELPSTPISSRVIREDGSKRLLIIADPGAATGQVGVAFLGAIFGGHRHVFKVQIGPGSANVVRIEVHGAVSRLSKVVVHLARDGSVLLRGEEVETLLISVKDDRLVVELSFRAFTSGVEWIYLFGREITDNGGPILTCMEASLEPLPEAVPYPVRHLPVKDVDGVSAICQSFTVLNNVFSLTFEVLKPGCHLVGLRLKTDLELAHARWWTWDLEHLRPVAGELVANRPVLPLRSPGLMDRFGPAHANEGHSISGMFVDWHDVDRMTIPEADRRANLTLHARFDCGTVVDLPVASILTNPDALPRSHALTEQYCAECLAKSADRPVFLEVGARGLASAQMRKKVEPEWHYVGLDYVADTNVDIVGDAHRLSDFVALNSVDLIYSSEVMEHLLSPLRFVLEANRVLRTDGLFIARMPTIWPLHAEPWDYWRITQHGWTSLLNINTGFEILDRCEDGRASVVPHLPEPNSGIMLMASAPAPMLTMVVARKIGDAPKDTSGWSPGLASGTYEHA